MPRPARRLSKPAFPSIETPQDTGGEVVFDTAVVVRALDRLITGRLQDLETLHHIATKMNTPENTALHNQLLALARSARTAFDDLQQSRATLVGLHKQASGGEVVASVDARTNLPNGRAFSTRLSESLRRLEPAHTLSLVLIEVGALQLLANEVGGAVANRVVRRLATILRRTVKRSDFVARIGPQHFALIFEDILPDKAVNIALRLHGAIETKLSPKGDPLAGLLSVNMGIAGAAGPGLSADDLLQRAHDAVIEARKEGRPAIYVA
jgi:diguanylate cyclase